MADPKNEIDDLVATFIALLESDDPNSLVGLPIEGQKTAIVGSFDVYFLVEGFSHVIRSGISPKTEK